MTGVKWKADNGHKTKTRNKANGAAPDSDDIEFAEEERTKRRPFTKLPYSRKTAIEYEYREADGTPCLMVLRWNRPDGKKVMRQAEFDEDGNLFLPAPKKDLPLYRLPELMEADDSKPVILVEGEKAVGKLVEYGYAATTWAGGTPGVKKADFSPLKNRHVVLWADADEPGRKAMSKVAAKVKPLAAKLRVVTPPEDAPDRWDAADVLKRREADDLIEAAVEWKTAKPSADVLQFAPDAGSKPVFLMNCDGFRLAIAHLGYEIRYNMREVAMEWRHKEGQWERVDNMWRDGVKVDLKRRVMRANRDADPSPYIVGRERFEEWCNAICFEDGPADEFLDWINALPKWDGVKRMETTLTECLDLQDGEDPELAKWASLYMFAGAVNRTLHPGAEQHESPILIGDPECGKTSFVKLVLPEKRHRDWVGRIKNMADSAKALVEALQGKVIVELSELAGMRRADTEAVKDFLSNPIDNNVRLAWRRDPAKILRRCIFAGTSDRDDCLPNDHNLRRFGVVRVKGKDGITGEAAYKRIKAYMDANREQIWAEAVAWIKAGNKPNMPDELKPAAKESAQEARSADSHMGDLLAEKEDALIKAAKQRDGMTTTEIVEFLELHDLWEKQPRSVEMRLSGELRPNGWKKHKRCRRAGKLVRLWKYEK